MILKEDVDAGGNLSDGGESREKRDEQNDGSKQAGNPGQKGWAAIS
jgi:hypothetical protein